MGGLLSILHPMNPSPWSFRPWQVVSVPQFLQVLAAGSVGYWSFDFTLAPQQFRQRDVRQQFATVHDATAIIAQVADVAEAHQPVNVRLTESDAALEMRGLQNPPWLPEPVHVVPIALPAAVVAAVS